MCYLKLSGQTLYQDIKPDDTISIALLNGKDEFKWLFFLNFRSKNFISYSEVIEKLLDDKQKLETPYGGLLVPHDMSNDSFSWEHAVVPIKTFGYCAFCGNT